MIKDKRILALIPARGGSKGILHKNIINLCGKPLLSYSISAGLTSKYIDYIMVSTDDKKIAEVAQRFGAEVPFMRPSKFATDTSKTIEAVLHAIETLKNQGEEFDILILLQPTQPLRTGADIDNAIERFFEMNCEPLASVSPVNDPPLLIRSIEKDKLVPLLKGSSTCRRQDMPQYYRINGCIYINQIKMIDENTSFNDNYIPFIMSKEHSVDIDEYSDLVMAEYYLRGDHSDVSPCVLQGLKYDVFPNIGK